MYGAVIEVYACDQREEDVRYVIACLNPSVRKAFLREILASEAFKENADVIRQVEEQSAKISLVVQLFIRYNHEARFVNFLLGFVAAAAVQTASETGPK